MKMIKVLIISNLYVPHYLGGYELLCKQVVDHLKQDNFELTVLTSDYGSNSKSEDGIILTLKLAGNFGQAPFKRQSFSYLNIFKFNYTQVKKVVSDSRPYIVFLWSQLRLTTAAINCIFS